VRKPFNLSCSMLLLCTRLGIENTGQQTKNHIDAVTVEGLVEICGRADVDEVRAVKEFVSRAIASDSAQGFLTNHLYHPKSFICLGLEKMTSPTTSDFGGLSRS
jgi:hypothetical protein